MYPQEVSWLAHSGHFHPLAPISFQDILFSFTSAVKNREGAALPLRSYAYCCQMEVRSTGTWAVRSSFHRREPPRFWTDLILFIIWG